MRIVYVQPAERLGGAERQGIVAMRLLPLFGIDVVPVVGPGDAVRRALVQSGIGHVFCPEFPGEFEEPAPYPERVARHARHMLSHYLLRDRIANIALERGADLVFASRPFGWVAGGAGARMARVPCVWRAGSRTTTRQQRAWLRLGSSLYKPVALVSNCRAVADSIHPLVSCPSYLVPNGVELDRFDPDAATPRFRDALGLGTDPVLGIVARPAREKGFDTLVTALEKLSKRVPELRVLVAGEYPGRGYYEDVFARVTHGRTRFVGHVDDVESFYCSCDVVCLASLERSVEGLSNAVLEAMAMERPVVATLVGGVTEAVTHGQEGWLVPPEDPAAIVERVVSLLQSPELRARMGAAGRSKVKAKFSAHVVVAHLAQLLREILENSRFNQRSVQKAAS